MPKTLQFRRGTTAELSSITGAVGELFVDTTKDVVVVSDGVTAGGFPLQAELVSNVNIKTINGTSVLGSGDITISGGDYGNANVAAYLPTYTGNLVSLAGNVTTTANISGSYILGNGSQLTGLPAGYANADVAAYLPTYTGNLVSLQGNVTTTANVSGSYFIGNGSQLTGVTASADFSEISEDVLPITTGIYDIGSADKRWYGAYVSNKIDIDGAEITGSEAGVVVTTLLAGELLVSDNLITPDDSTARQYLGNQGVVVINGNMDIDGEYLGAPVVETRAAVPGTEAGALDTNFDIGTGFSRTPPPGDRRVRALALQTDGKLIATGDFADFQETSVNSIIRLNTDGSRDTSFATGSGLSGPSAEGYAIGIQSDGKIVIGGVFSNYDSTSVNQIVRVLGEDGSFDSSFVTGSGFLGEVYSVSIQSDGKILVGGKFSSYNSTSANCIIRLAVTGSIDGTFSSGTGITTINGLVNTIAVQSDDKILIGGYFDSYNSTSANCITRLSSDGSIDGTFNIGTGIGHTSVAPVVRSIVVQSDGKILVGGLFNRYNGTEVFNLVRLDSDGSIDSSFETTFAESSTGGVNSIVVQSDGLIVVGGDFDLYNSVETNNIVRLNSDGSRDTSFEIGTGFSDPAFSSIVRDTGEILIGGEFATYNAVSSPGLVQLESVTSPEIPASVVPTGGEEGFIRYNKDILAYQGYNGTSWELLQRVTTPPTAITEDGENNADIDFTGAQLRTVVPSTAAIAFTGSNYLAGSTVTVRVSAGEDIVTVDFPTDWVFVGTKPTDLAANKTAMLTVTSFSTTEAECVAAWAVQT